MPVEIDIDDLLQPRLNEAQIAAIAYGDATPVEFSEKAILDFARARTGHSDFGPDDFRARLNMLCDEWNADPGLSNIHRITLWGYVSRYAVNRLLIQDILKRHPEIHDEVIDRPIIVAGLPRSGTTHLVNLIAADKRLRSLPLWESYEPLPLPGEPMLPDGTDPRWQRCADAWVQMKATVPLLASMHHPNALGEIAPHGVLQEKPPRARLERPQRLNVPLEGREHDHLGARKLLANSRRCLDSTTIWKLDVHQHDIRSMLSKQRQGFRRGLCLCHNADIRFQTQHRGDAFAKHRVVVDGEDGNGLTRHDRPSQRASDRCE